MIREGEGEIYRSSQKHQSVPLHYLNSTGLHLLGVSLLNGLKSNLRSAITTQNSTDNNCTVSFAINMMPFQSTVSLAGIYQSPVTGRRWSAFCSIHSCYGQVQTAQSLPVQTHTHTNTHS
jgi:hypothetical protein